MKNLIYLLSVALFQFSCQKNQPPIINSIEVLTDTIVGASIVDIAVEVDDEDVLQYEWTATGGEFISSADLSVVSWQAPTEIEDKNYTIVVKVIDGEWKVSDAVDINVAGGKFVDHRDSTIYKFVQIGEQIWMAENLKYLPAVNLSNDGSRHDPFYYVYKYSGTSIEEAKSKENYDMYGVLYNWAAATISCPDGWNLPNDDEWKELELFLGMDEFEIDLEYSRVSGNVGLKLKSSSGWSRDGVGINSHGFKALPAGYGFPNSNNWDKFRGLGSWTVFWTSTRNSIVDTFSCARILKNYDVGVTRSMRFYKSHGYSVRCIKD